MAVQQWLTLRRENPQISSFADFPTPCSIVQYAWHTEYWLWLDKLELTDTVNDKQQGSLSLHEKMQSYNMTGDSIA